MEMTADLSNMISLISENYDKGYEQGKKDAVVHAKWEGGCCSRCGWARATDSEDDYLGEDDNHYCYNCGAKMDGGEQDGLD